VIVLIGDLAGVLIFGEAPIVPNNKLCAQHLGQGNLLERDQSLYHTDMIPQARRLPFAGDGGREKVNRIPTTGRAIILVRIPYFHELIS
jgi:hypothetical protein